MLAYRDLDPPAEYAEQMSRVVGGYKLLALGGFGCVASTAPLAASSNKGRNLCSLIGSTKKKRVTRRSGPRSWACKQKRAQTR